MQLVASLAHDTSSMVRQPTSTPVLDTAKGMGRMELHWQKHSKHSIQRVVCIQVTWWSQPEASNLQDGSLNTARDACPDTVSCMSLYLVAVWLGMLQDHGNCVNLAANALKCICCLLSYDFCLLHKN